MSFFDTGCPFQAGERGFHLMRAGELAGELAQEQRGTTAEHLAAMCAIRDELRLLPAPV